MNNDFKKNLGLRIRELRIANKYTQEQLAEKVDMERSNLTRIERGNQFPNAENLEKFTKIFNITSNELFDFNHYKDKTDLINEINQALENFDTDRVQFVHKTVMNLKSI